MNYNQLMKGVTYGTMGASTIGTVAGAIAGSKNFEEHPVIGGLGGAMAGNMIGGAVGIGTSVALTQIMKRQIMKSM